MAGRTYGFSSSRASAVREGGLERGEIQSVSDLTRRIKDLLESQVAPAWVRGEVSNLRLQASGHIYFSLKDATAQLACVMFRGDTVRGGGNEALRDGAQVIVFGSVSVYEPQGKYQLIVRAVVDDGLGRLRVAFEQLKQRLAAEGLFDRERKKPLPVAPKTIGFVTSPTGAVVQDFIRILKRRDWRGRLVIIPAKVQGMGAAEEMVAALQLAASLTREEPGANPDKSGFDLLVIGRGGGSLEDLWAFNEEALVRAVAACPIPVISAVGHEIDFTLCDFAADVRAETPSAAAELVTSGFLDFVERVRQSLDTLDEVAAAKVRAGKEAARLLLARMAGVSPSRRLEAGLIRYDEIQSRLDGTLQHRLSRCRERFGEVRTRVTSTRVESCVAAGNVRLTGVAARLERESGQFFRWQDERLRQLGDRLRALGPEAVLKRGFVILRDDRGAPLTSAADATPGDRLEAAFRDGTIRVRVEE